MAHTNKVLKSFNLPGDHICVDLFRRPDGTFGYEEFRREPEDGRGWFAIGFHDHRRFRTAEDALNDARKVIAWLGDVAR